MAKTTVELPDTLHRTLRVKAALDNRSMNDIIVTALKGYLSTFQLNPSMLDIDPVAQHQAESRTPSKER